MARFFTLLALVASAALVSTTGRAMQTSGANLIEIGFPFSDPVADGPIIQESFTYALSKRVKVSDVFSVIRQARPDVSIPMFGMLSFSIVFRYGVERFIAEARSAGLDGLIIPDLPPPEAQKQPNPWDLRGCSSMVEQQPSKLMKSS